MLPFYLEKMYRIIHGGDLSRNERSNLISATTMSLKLSDKNVFNLHEDFVLLNIAVFCFFVKVLLQNHRLTVRASYYFD